MSSPTSPQDRAHNHEPGLGQDPEQGNVHQSRQRSEARKALDGLDRDGYSYVLGALAESAPVQVRAAVAQWERLEASR